MGYTKLRGKDFCLRGGGGASWLRRCFQGLRWPLDRHMCISPIGDRAPETQMDGVYLTGVAGGGDLFKTILRWEIIFKGTGISGQ